MPPTGVRAGLLAAAALAGLTWWAHATAEPAPGCALRTERDRTGTAHTLTCRTADAAGRRGPGLRWRCTVTGTGDGTTIGPTAPTLLHPDASRQPRAGGSGPVTPRDWRAERPGPRRAVLHARIGPRRSITAWERNDRWTYAPTAPGFALATVGAIRQGHDLTLRIGEGPTGALPSTSETKIAAGAYLAACDTTGAHWRE